ncbi:MAG: purine-binding chemotaxis protein CheW [Enterobacterales bacterium]
MKDKLGNNLAEAALDDYLNVLLSSDEPLACEQKFDSSKALSGSKLYHLNTHPNRQSKSIQPDPDKRHNFERVERLLDDFNRRQHVETDEDLAIALQVKDEPTIVLQPSVLRTDEEMQQEQSDSTDEEENSNRKLDVIDENNVIEAEEELEQANVIIPENIDIVREDWSNKPFQTLLFDVAGIRLALPLVKLGGIHRITEEITPLFGKPKWFRGLIPGLEGNINVIDTAKWIMPDKYERLNETDLDYKFIILLDNTNWGLCCNVVQNAINLEPENVRWRKSAGKRPWLAGMLIEEMAALLDVDTLIYLLNENFPR